METTPTVPDIAGTCSGPLLILGDGRCVWDDVKALGADKAGRNGTLKFDGDVMCVNGIGFHVEEFRHWYSNDGKWLQRLHAARRPEWAKMFPGSIRLHTNMPTQGLIVWPWNSPGSSGLNACRTGIALGYDDIILCGMPLDDSGHNGDPEWKTTNFTREVSDTADGNMNRFWREAARTVFQGKVKSMSGRTREWLGGPDRRL